MGRPDIVRWCAAFLVLGAVFGMTRAFVALGFVFFGEDPGFYLSTEWSYYVVVYTYLLFGLLISVGTLGFLAVMPGGMENLRKLMKVGIAASAVASLVLLFGATYELLSSPAIGPTRPLLNSAFLLASFSVLPAALLTFPLLMDWFLTYFVYPQFEYGETLDVVLYSSPQLLAGLLWVSVGVALLGAGKREAAFVSSVRVSVETTNLKIARRLYEEAWVRNDMAVLSELVFSDVVDEYYGNEGIENFQRNVRGLRRTFPDLLFTIIEQSANHDTVTTRWSLSGTDEGGILWYPPTGQHVSISGHFTDTFRDGVIVEHRGESNAREVVGGLGGRGSES